MRVHFETPDDGYSYFFGYYDRPALNRSNTILLAHRVEFDGREVRDYDIADVGYFSLSTGKFTKLDSTLAWNWQQGSHLQWLPPHYDDTIVYNVVKDNKFSSVVLNISNGQRREIDFAIYALHPNGIEALGINYERHFWCRPGYNYQNVKNEKWNVSSHCDDGIYKINLKENTADLLVSTDTIRKTLPRNDFSGVNHWLEHMLYSPCGERFLFFHRWDNGKSSLTRAFTCNSSTGKGLFMYPDVGFYSHAAWIDSKQLSIWTYEPLDIKKTPATYVRRVHRFRALKRIAKKVYPFVKLFISKKSQDYFSSRSRLLIYQDETFKYKSVGLGKVSGNGHQSWINDGSIVICDTYQDSDNQRSLYTYEPKTDKFTTLISYLSLYNDSIYRCDLHPRLSLDERLVVVDSSHRAQRKIIILALDRMDHE